MSRPRHYSPAIKRHLVTALYYEAKRQGRPMTDLTNDIVERAAREWQTTSAIPPESEIMVLHEAPSSPHSH